MILVIVFAGLMLAHGMRREAGYLQFPAMAALLCLLWFTPQLASLWNDPTLPVSGQNRLISMMLLCLAAIWLGWYAIPTLTTPKPAPELSRLVPVAAALTVLSVLVNLLLNRYRAEITGNQQWSGPITIIAFFAQIRDIALPLSLILFLQFRTKVTTALLLINLSVTMPIAFTLLRRSEMVGLGAAILCGYWFARRIKISMIVLSPALLLLVLIVYVIGPLRGAAAAIEIATGDRPSILNPAVWAQINLEAAITKSVSLAHDLRNALYVIDYNAETLSFQLGANVWNGFVSLYVPGQIFGYGFKNALYFERGSHFEKIFEIYNFRYSDGTTSTGFGSAFADFGYLGAAYFFAMSAALRRMFLRAEAGMLWSQVAYMCFLPLALVSLTHGHERFFVTAPFVVIVIVVFRRLARYRFVFSARSRRAIRPDSSRRQ